VENQQTFFDNLFSQIDIMKLLESVAPGVVSQLRGTKKGRPRKLKWDEQVAKGVVVAKLGLSYFACQALMRHGIISVEETMVVVGYVAERLKELSLAECFPSSSKWVVREALKTFGRADVDEIVLSWDSVMNELSLLSQAYTQTKEQEKAMRMVLDQMRRQPKVG